MTLGLLLLLLLSFFQAFAQNLPPRPERFILDEAGAFQAAQAQDLRQALEAFDRHSQHGIYVHTALQAPSGFGGQAFACRLFQHWNLDSNSLLILILRQERRAYLCHASKLDLVLSPARKQRILDLYLGPSLHREAYAQALERGLPALQAHLLSLPQHLQYLPQFRQQPLALAAFLAFLASLGFLLWRMGLQVWPYLHTRPWVPALALLLLVLSYFYKNLWYWWACLLWCHHLYRFYVYYPSPWRFLLIGAFGLGALPLLLLSGELINEQASFFQLWLVAPALIPQGIAWAYAFLAAWLPLALGLAIFKNGLIFKRLIVLILALGLGAYMGLEGYRARELLAFWHGLGLWLPGLPSFAPLMALGFFYVFAYWFSEWFWRRI